MALTPTVAACNAVEARGALGSPEFDLARPVLLTLDMGMTLKTMTTAGRVGLLWMSGAVMAGSLGACEFEGPVSGAEMRQAMGELVLTGEARSLEDGVVEITTHFTLGDGVEAIAEEVRAFGQSQVACSTITSPEPGVLEIDFGVLEDACTYRGKTYAGIVTVSWEHQGDSVLVVHDYDGLTNGHVTLDGVAEVTWTTDDRHVKTDFSLESDDAKVDFSSDRTQTWLGSLGEGIRVNGEHEWSGPSGEWRLDVDEVELRWIDPVPQAGTYALTLPRGAVVTVDFERVDDNTIEVTMSGGRNEQVFHVTAAGIVSEE